MNIRFAPMRRDDRLDLVREGDVLIVNGARIDLSDLAEGETLARDRLACDWLADDVTRQDGVLRVALILPHGADAGPATLFPEVLADPADGPVALPPDSGLTDSGLTDSGLTDSGLAAAEPAGAGAGDRKGGRTGGGTGGAADPASPRRRRAKDR